MDTPIKKKIRLKVKENKTKKEEDILKVMDKIAKQHKKNKYMTVTSLDPLNLNVE